MRCSEIFPTVNNNFEQLLNQYHTAHLPVYDSVHNEIHTFFFGGMALYEYDVANQALVMDALVPFVKTISQVTRFGDGSMEAFRLSFDMPGYLGASAEFIPVLDAPYTAENILELNAIGQDSVLIGYIVGGIESDTKNVFMQAAGNTWVSNRVFKVYLNWTGAANAVADELEDGLALFCKPVPAKDVLSVVFELGKAGQAEIMLQDPSGRIVWVEKTPTLGYGKHEWQINTTSIAEGMYICRVTTQNQSESVRIFVKR